MTITGLPTVYLPGAAGLASFWQPVAELRHRQSEPFVFGYPGFGETPRDPAVRSISDLTHWILARSPECFDLVAQSMGGVLALRIALDHGPRVRRLALVATSGGVDAVALGAAPWRSTTAEWMPAAAPRWFVDDDTDFTSRLGEVRTPTLVVCGDDDPLAPPAVGEFLQRRLTGARLVVVAGATHDFAIEEPDVMAGLLDHHFSAS